jgi:hypothetical protein
MLDLDAVRKRYTRQCSVCGIRDETCPLCEGTGWYLDLPDHMEAMLAELERLYAAPVAEPVQPTTPGAREAAIEGELRRMQWKPRGGTLTPSPVCQGCGSLAVFVQSSEKGGTIHVCGNCWREW